ncbi:LPS O-antigen chain length determinant protein WzzB [Pseudomonas aeruginosa]|uniref:LPS O-antigen chain length determinant protein WzzB n=1 Tax=Pseudomonas aeruginosa TaxID=287 RepID=UPI0039E16A1F
MTEETFFQRVAKNEEFDLIGLLRGLWAEKWLIACITILTTSLVGTYAFLSKPVYEARIAVLPPSWSSIAGFNLGRAENGLTTFSVNDIYSVFLRNLLAEETRRNFFREVYLPSLSENERSGSKDRLYSNLSEEMEIQRPSKDERERYTVIFEKHDPSQAADWGRRYIKLAAEGSMKEMQDAVQREFEVKSRNIQQQIDILRDAAKARREDRINRLKEAYQIAQSLKLENPPLIGGQMDQQLSSIMEGALMYMRGTKALRAEIRALEERTSDDPFIPALRNLQEKQAMYSTLKLDVNKVAVFRQDGAAEVPDDPVRPKKGMLLMLGALSGFVWGGMIAFIIMAVRRSRAK